MDGPLAIAEALLAHPTAPFHEDLVAEHCLAFARERGIEAERDAAGNVVLRHGTGDAPLVLVAHLDHPGFVVDETADDRVAMTFHGGLGSAHAVEGSPVAFFRPGHDEPVGHGALIAADDKAGRLTGATAEVLHGEAVSGGIAMWDFPAWQVEEGRITSRVCDDLLGAAAILACLDDLRRRGCDAPVWGLLTRAEEVGFLGAIEAIRLGTVPSSASVLSLECSKALPSARQGDGVIVRVGDRMSVFAPALTESLRTAADALAARNESFRYQRKLMDGGACEATVFCASGFRASGLAVPLGNYHNASDDGIGITPENVLVDDYLAEVALLVELGADPGLLDDETPEPPQWLQERAATARDALGAA
jgi:putative aminopeptidase FrvX